MKYGIPENTKVKYAVLKIIFVKLRIPRIRFSNYAIVYGAPSLLSILKHQSHVYDDVSLMFLKLAILFIVFIDYVMS